jgi:hypothetical protein
MARLEKGPLSAFLAQSKIRIPSVPGIVAGKPIPISKKITSDIFAYFTK